MRATTSPMDTARSLNLPPAKAGGGWNALLRPLPDSPRLGTALVHHPGSQPPLGVPAPKGTAQASLARATRSVPFRGGTGEPAPSRVGSRPARTPHAGAVPHPARPLRPGPRRAGTSHPRLRTQTSPTARCRGRVARLPHTGMRATAATAVFPPAARNGRPAITPWCAWEKR